MSIRREAVERYVDRQEQWWSDQLAQGRITPEEYNNGMRDLQREAQDAAREAMEADIEDAIDDWRW